MSRSKRFSRVLRDLCVFLWPKLSNAARSVTDGFPAARVEPHDPVEVHVVHGPPVGTLGQPRDDLPGAGHFLVGRDRPAGEDGAPARRVGDAGDVVRPADGEVAQVGHRCDSTVLPLQMQIVIP